jgi:tetratricopeptide (TPR) repeat protein
MIRLHDEPSGKNPAKNNPRALLQSIERHLSKTSRITGKKADEAQQLVYDAWEAPTDAEEQALIYRALEIDPTNVDALLQAAVYAGVDGEEEIELLRKVVAIGEKNLGPKAFKEFAGAFWGFVETRPYMRARERLAEVLRVAGRLNEAAAEYQAMLELNPNDNQGVRYSLLPCLLMLNRLADARKLFEKYPGEFEFNAVFAWGRVLERFLAGDLSGAEAALAVARKQNPHMQVYVKGHRQPPRFLPEAYAPGSKEEAVCFAEVLQAAWAKYPAAFKWLETQKVK